MTTPGEGSHYRQTILGIEENMGIRTQLCFRMAKFMLGLAEVINSRQLKRVSYQYWGTATRPSIKDRTHNFEVEDAERLSLPEEVYAGGLFVPSEVRIAFDTGIDTDVVQYDLRGERTTDRGIESEEFLVTLINPRDALGASWQLLANPGEYEVTRPMDGVMSHENNRQFDGVSAAIQESLGAALFRRFS